MKTTNALSRLFRKQQQSREKRKNAKSVGYSMLHMDDIKKFCTANYDEADRSDRINPVSAEEIQQLVKRLAVKPEIARMYLELSGLDANHEFVDTDFQKMAKIKPVKHTE